MFTIIFGIFCNTSGEISKAEAIILIVLFISFIIYTIVMGKKGEKFDSKDEDIEKQKTKDKKQVSILRNIINIILGMVALKFGGDFIVDNATIIAEYFKISEQIISLTIVAIGTSLPELVTSIVAAIKGDSDISIGNIIGSNIFNMTLVIGLSAFIKPMAYNVAYNIQMGILISANIILALFPIIPPKNKMNRSNGIIYLILYIVYSIMLFKI